MTKPNTAWVEKYLGIPWTADSISPKEGLNCWGVLQHIYRQELGIELPEYVISAKNIRAIQKVTHTNQGLEPWAMRVQIGQEKAFDGVLMKGLVQGHTFDMHVGLITTPGYLLHIERDIGVCHVKLVHPTVRHRVVAIYRHESQR